MLTSLLTVAQKVVALFLMIGVGYGCAKLRVITQRGTAQITTILLYIVTPCLIISSLQNAGEDVSIQTILFSGFLAVLTHLVGIVVSFLFFRKSEDRQKKVLRFSIIYSNCGFMGLPLIQAVLGEQAVIYASVYIAVFNVFVWTHGYAMMSGGQLGSIKKIIFNPGVIGLAVGLPLFLMSIKLPDVIGSPLHSFADLNTPLAMIVIGNHIAKVNWKEFFSEKEVYLVSLYRLLLVPLFCLGFLCLIKPEPLIFKTLMISSSAPTAATCVLFAAQYGKDVKLASKIIAITTILSIFSMPIIVVVTDAVLSIL